MVRSVFALCDDSGHKRFCRRVPFEVDCARDVGVGAMKFCPAGIASGHFLTRYCEMILLQTPVVSDGFSETAAPIAGYLNNALHSLESLSRALPKSSTSRYDL